MTATQRQAEALLTALRTEVRRLEDALEASRPRTAKDYEYIVHCARGWEAYARRVQQDRDELRQRLAEADGRPRDALARMSEAGMDAARHLTPPKSMDAIQGDLLTETARRAVREG